MHVLEGRVVQLINKHKFKRKDRKHAEELERVLECSTILKNITKNYDLVQNN